MAKTDGRAIVMWWQRWTGAPDACQERIHRSLLLVFAPVGRRNPDATTQ